jgi:hypothetical protein
VIRRFTAAEFAEYLESLHDSVTVGELKEAGIENEIDQWVDHMEAGDFEVGVECDQ